MHEKRWGEEEQAGIKTAGRNINNLRYADDTTFIAESEEELKSLLMKVKEALIDLGEEFSGRGAFPLAERANIVNGMC